MGFESMWEESSLHTSNVNLPDLSAYDPGRDLRPHSGYGPSTDSRPSPDLVRPILLYRPSVCVEYKTIYVQRANSSYGRPFVYKLQSSPYKW